MKMIVNIAFAVVIIGILGAWANDVYCSWAFQMQCMYGEPVQVGN